ncbi:MAG: HD domain-containing phosphohydrolase [Parashewanella sp.]
MASKPTILIVDDMPENIDVLSSALMPDYHVKVSLHGEKALQLAQNKEDQPNLILLDIMMPNMDGYEVCRQLKANPITKDIPIIFVTASNTAMDEVKALSVGGVDYISKPIIPEIVRARVTTHLHLNDQALHFKSLVFKKTKEIRQTKQQILDTLCRAAAYKDNETQDHVERMSLYAELLAKKVNNDKEWVLQVKQSAQMHDIGKIGIEDKILLKPGKLDESEIDKIQTHVLIGAKIIGDESTPLLKMSRDVALYHHEKWDGTGYASGLSRTDIPLEARIVAVADVFDALTSSRSYKKAWSVEEALAYIEKESGSHFDPMLAKLFVQSREEILAIKLLFEK